MSDSKNAINRLECQLKLLDVDINLRGTGACFVNSHWISFVGHVKRW